MTRRAKERRQERVQEKQQAMEKRLQREAQLSRRPEWRALLLRIDGTDDDAQAVVSPRHQLPRKDASDSDAAAAAAAAATVATAVAAKATRASSTAAIADAIQWKSTHVPIAASSVFQLPIKVDAPHATLLYEFSTRDFDISFGIQLIGVDGAMRELSAVQRYESHVAPIKGQLELPGPAMVLLVWDNSFSWLNTKQLKYSIELKQDFPDAGLSPNSAATPSQRAALALHERAKRENLRVRREASQENLQATIIGHDQQIELLKFQIEELRKSLETTEALKETTIKEQQGVEEEIEALTWEIDALLWRSMGVESIHTIFSFCGPRELLAWSLANHQWQQRVLRFRELEETPVLDDAVEAVPEAAEAKAE